MKLRTPLTLLLFTGCSLVFAQNEPVTKVNDRAQFEMIKSTLEFLATDKVTNPRSSGQPCADCRAYDDLTQYIRRNRINGGDNLVKEAQTEARRILQRQPEQPLVKFRDYLIDKITEGSTRAHRKTLPTYSGYTQSLNDIIADAGEQTTGASTDEDNPPSATEEALDAAGGERVTPAPMVTEVQNETPSDTTETSEKPFYGLLALILGIINSALIALLFLRSRKPTALQDPIVGGADDGDIRQRLFDLETERAILLNRLKALEASVGEPTLVPPVAAPDRTEPYTGGRPTPRPEDRPTPQPNRVMPPPANTLRSDVTQSDVTQSDVTRSDADQPDVPADSESQPMTEGQVTYTAPPTAPQPQAETPPVQSVAPEPTPATQPPMAAAPVNRIRTAPSLLYGRMADLGDGFSAGGLLEQPDRDTVFEIQKLNDTEAAYRVSENSELQRLALSDPYSYLNDTCAYLTQPRPDSRIRTEKPGRLTLQGEKWLITQKAQISFT